MPICIYATHNRAGEITYEHISGYTYKITLVTYTYTPSAANEDRNELTISWGDDTFSEISRISIEYLPDDYQKNTYTGDHSFPGPGTYYILMEDKNRNAGIDNIVESVFIPFAIKTKLVINPFITDNSTPQLLNPPIDKAVVGSRFVHNPTAYDQDGDSLSYMLTVCSGSLGKPIEDYSYPVASDSLYVDPLTGDLVWDAPVSEGRYNVAMVILEYRDGIQISAIVRDIQIDVEKADNTPPVILDLEDQCVIVGDSVSFPVESYDVDNDNVVLTAVGGVFETIGTVADFSTVVGQSPVQSGFKWNTECDHVRQQPYSILFKATDDGATPLSDQEYVSVLVRGKPASIDSIHDDYNGIYISALNASCENAERLRLYRSIGDFSLDDSLCNAEMPDEYVLLVDTLDGVDAILDLDVTPGYKYCYRLETVYEDGAVSYPSESVCVERRVNAPVFSKASVLSDVGSESVVALEWTQYVIDSTSPVKSVTYVLQREDVDSTTSVWNEVFMTDSVGNVSYIDSVISPKNDFISYRLLTLLKDDDSNIVDTLFTTTSTVKPVLQVLEDGILIHIEDDASWINEVYTVYKFNESEESWDSITSLRDPTFYDTIVVYDETIRYKVLTQGSYGLIDYPSDILNWSHESSIHVEDSFAPVVEYIEVTPNCEDGKSTISWSVDADDVSHFYVLYKSCIASNNFLVLDTIGEDLRSYSFIDENKTGCYSTQAVDFAGNVGELSKWACVEACPSYVLPSVFTPNGNSENEVFRPLQNEFVLYVEVEIYNIWGDLVFSTDDLNINWSGVNNNEEVLPDGMYYYICEVFEEWSSCEVESRTLIGFVYKFSDGNVNAE